MTKSSGEVLSTSPLPPPSLYSLGSSAVEDAGHMPRCHSPFPFSNLALSSVTAINHSRRHGDGALGEASVRPSIIAAATLSHSNRTPPQRDVSTEPGPGGKGRS
ncbi:hypothetical protein KUCAC02_022422 [Chaenocephalus aceratus]|uniref:Uncharacterized protein n=1 Tax=Chaenocephalus aceratus TaxID=36190 RepID=A0ACB9XN21_CHAAC|nr:hypothetical protein KUCAC02_022422 [Chaenocephalus aceratus]